jgi:hypothetical protein
LGLSAAVQIRTVVPVLTMNVCIETASVSTFSLVVANRQQGFQPLSGFGKLPLQSGSPSAFDSYISNVYHPFGVLDINIFLFL